MKAYTTALTISLLSSLAIAGVTEDFEGYSIGDSPAGIWQDAADFITNPTNASPTVQIIGTTDAMGNATNAMQIQDGLGTSGGLIAQVGHDRIQRFETDLRLDQAGNGSSPNWISAAGLFQQTVQDDFNWMPQAFVYATRGSNRFRLFVQNADGRGGANRDFGLGIHSWEFDTWYRVVLEADTQTGQFDVSIINQETGEVLVDATRTYLNWNSAFGQYDHITVNDGEYGNTIGTIGNMATIDNIGYVPSPASVMGLVGGGLIGSRRRR
jgi:hypothetical protein